MNRKMRQIVTNDPSYTYSITNNPPNNHPIDILMDTKNILTHDISLYKHHDNYEPQIPPHISIICVASAHFYLIPGTLFLFCKQPSVVLFGCTLLALYVSSIIHWRYPMFDSLIHYIDFFFVIENTASATYILYTLSNTAFTIWIVNVSVAFPIFIMNEILYYYQVKVPKNILRKDPTFKPIAKNLISKISKTDSTESNDVVKWTDHFQNYFSLEPTWPNTPEREYAYYRSVITHAIFIHGLTGGIAGISVSLIIFFFYQ